MVCAFTECGDGCTMDGIHYGNATYDAALQIVLNRVLLAGA